MKRVLILAVAFLLISASIAQADILTPVEGNPVQGKVSVTHKGYVLELPGGSTVTYMAKDVICVQFSPTITEQYQKKVSALSAHDADGHYNLAQWCGQNSLQKELQQALKTVISINPEHEKARKSMGYEWFNNKWMLHGAVLTAKGFVEFDGAWMTPSERDWMQSLANEKLANQELGNLLNAPDPGDPQNLARISELMINSDAKERETAMLVGLRSKDARFREFCAKGLSEFADEKAFDSLVDVALLDKRREVRVAAVNSVGRISQNSNVSAEQPFIHALSDERAAVRIAAADALGYVGTSGAVESILMTYRFTWGSGARNHIAIVRQHAYIEDYDVQVATAATVADPVIGIIQEGLVLDAKPLAVERVITVLERRVLRDALSKILPTGPGPDVESWEDMNKWWADNRAKYIK